MANIEELEKEVRQLKDQNRRFIRSNYELNNECVSLAGSMAVEEEFRHSAVLTIDKQNKQITEISRELANTNELLAKYIKTGQEIVNGD